MSCTVLCLLVYTWPKQLTAKDSLCIWFMFKWKSLSHVRLFLTPWTTQFMEFSKPEYWSGQPFSSLSPGIEPRSPSLQVDSLPAEPLGSPDLCLHWDLLSFSVAGGVSLSFLVKYHVANSYKSLDLSVLS